MNELSVSVLSLQMDTLLPYLFQTHINKHGRFTRQYTNRRTYFLIKLRLLVIKLGIRPEPSQGLVATDGTWVSYFPTFLSSWEVP